MTRYQPLHAAREISVNQAVDVGIAVFGTTLRITIDIEAVLQP